MLPSDGVDAVTGNETVVPAAGWLLKTIVNCAVPPDSVVTRGDAATNVKPGTFIIPVDAASDLFKNLEESTRVNKPSSGKGLEHCVMIASEENMIYLSIRDIFTPA